MRDWSLGPGDPLYLTLAADSRLCTPDYVNDHIWELEMGSGEPPAFTLRTTYGMRARSMRLFLRFTENGRSVLDPAAFPVQPTLRRFTPNFLVTEFYPLENISFTAEFWVPESQALAGRLTVTNRTSAMRQIRLELCVALTPLEGQSATGIQQQLVNILAGQTGGLFPVVFMTGGPKHGPGPYPSLALDLDLNAGDMRQFTFAEAARETLAASFELARHTAARRWDAERARIELLDTATTVDIQTGDPDWDAALAFSQRAALGLFFRGNEKLPYSSFVSVRQPDHGFSRKGDGLDYAPAWGGQSPMDAYYLASLLPGAPDFARQTLLNFLSTQMESGEVDNKPGLGGQTSKLPATPVLASLAWRCYEVCEDKLFLQDVYPRLLKFFWSWFSPEHDDKRDGVPEWEHLLQTGFEDNPLFDVWHPWSQGADISMVHTPELSSMLYREAQCLLRMAEALGVVEKDPLLLAQSAVLKESVEAGWNARNALYTYRDRDTGLSQPGELVLRGQPGESRFRPKHTFKHPVRLLIQVETSEHATKRLEVELAEYVTKGEPEVLQAKDFPWRSGGLVATTRKVYSRLGSVKIRGLDEQDVVTIRSLGLETEDQTLLLPLWAGIPDHQRAQALLGRTILDAQRFDHPFGLPALPDIPDSQAEMIARSVHLPWNALIAEGLLDYGFRTEAARLNAHLMNAVIQSLKLTRAFYQRYHAETGSGIGERNALSGLAPVGIFLRSLGVSILSPQRVRLEGLNPYPWPVTVKYRGLVVLRDLKETTITFPNGATTVITDPTPTLVSI